MCGTLGRTRDGVRGHRRCPKKKVECAGHTAARSLLNRVGPDQYPIQHTIGGIIDRDAADSATVFDFYTDLRTDRPRSEDGRPVRDSLKHSRPAGHLGEKHARSSDGGAPEGVATTKHTHHEVGFPAIEHSDPLLLLVPCPRRISFELHAVRVRSAV